MTKSSYLLSMLSSLALLAGCGGSPAPGADAPAMADTTAAPAGAPSVMPSPAPSAMPSAAPSAMPSATPGAAMPSDMGKPVEATIEARSKSKLAGTATFTPVEGGVKVLVNVTGAKPGKLATHIHEKGDCSAPDAKSAGEHFNPEKKPHGMPDSAAHHIGDLGNMEVKADGTGTLEITAKGASLKEGDPNSFLGRALIVHEKVDDGGQPSGNAGGRIGCAVIGTAGTGKK